MKLKDFMTDETERLSTDPWYDWFCKDTALAGRVTRQWPLIQLLAMRYADRFTNTEIFLKQNPGWHGNFNTDTMLVQLHEKDYPRKSLRVCLSIVRYTSQKQHNPDLPFFLYELSVWKEGEDIGTPLISTKVRKEMRDFLTTYHP